MVAYSISRIGWGPGEEVTCLALRFGAGGSQKRGGQHPGEADRLLELQVLKCRALVLLDSH